MTNSNRRNFIKTAAIASVAVIKKIKKAGSKVDVSISTDNEKAALLGATSMLYTA
ncbi:twin-arginine translocation signal domain-containing protein [Flavobacterium sp. ALJ2]|uniref:twin-arginine translocation signal domain-containing protein n=1 Tax=Flavobacterium sp. ALJ2 TaxID=2786960 RepID=UPI00189DBE5B|nr:twin-arginine translocation signal domain-containing protein [Flavobacterium sp. ALJ2]MBF7093334.1 twin-arginine translocation signal domain-containing protein [Flavobacterium sp. ALJ2]